MGDYVISCCSAVDLTAEWLQKRDIRYVSFTYTLGDEDYTDDMWVSMKPAELYQRMIAGEDAKTSQISTAEYIKHFKSILKEGKDVIHLTLSSGISGTYNSAMLARQEVIEEFPDRRIFVVDSLAASSGFGLFMETLADLRDEGKTIDELYDFAKAQRLHLNHWFFSTDLTFYIKGGRVTKTAGFIGNVLNICPLLNMDYLGRLIPREKIRTKKKVIQRSLEKMIENAENGTDYNGKCFISHSDCYEDARALADKIEENFPNLNGKVEIFSIGATIGSHTGPGTVALFFWGNKRVD